DTFDYETGWPYEINTGPVEDPRDPKFDYAAYVPDPVAFACSFIIPSDESRLWDGQNMNTSRINGPGKGQIVGPGDIVCIDGNDAGQDDGNGNLINKKGQLRPNSLVLRGMIGSAESPVKIVNYGNVVTVIQDMVNLGAAVKVQQSKHVVFSGTGDR